MVKNALRLLCNDCNKHTSHESVSETTVQTEHAILLRNALRRNGLYAKQPHPFDEDVYTDGIDESNAIDRVAFVRGRRCVECGRMHLTVELPDSFLLRHFEGFEVLSEIKPKLSELEKLQKTIKTILG